MEINFCLGKNPYIDRINGIKHFVALTKAKIQNTTVV